MTTHVESNLTFLSREELEQRSRTLDSDGGPLMPPTWFTSKEFHDLEVECIWRHVWQEVCRESELAEVGDYVEYEIAGESILVVRESADRLRAFSNVCRHRGNLLKRGTGSVREIRCSYHGWKYGLDGCLDEITNDWDFPHVDRQACSLPAFQVDTWGGWVWVNLDPAAEPLREFLAPLPALFEQHYMRATFRIAALQVVAPCNWKIAYQGNLESYHGPWTHPQILFLDEIGAKFELLGRHGRTITPYHQSPNGKEAIDDETFVEDFAENYAALDLEFVRRELSQGKTGREAVAAYFRSQAEMMGMEDPSSLTDSDILDPITYSFFPNFQMVVGFGGSGITIRVRPNGNDPESCIFDFWLFAPMPEGVTYPDAPIVAFPMGTSFADAFQEVVGGPHPLAVILDQDLERFIGMQKGMGSAYYPGAPLGLYQESLIRRMNDGIRDYIARYRPDRAEVS